MRLLFQALIVVLVLLVFPLPGNQASILHNFNVRFPVVSKVPQKPPHLIRRPVVADYAPVSPPAIDFAPPKKAELPQITLDEKKQGTKEKVIKEEIVEEEAVESPIVEGRIAEEKNAEMQPVKAQNAETAPSEQPPKLKRLVKSEVNFTAASLPKQSVVVVGDSLSIPLGQRLEEYFTKYDDISFARRGKVSSGLARPDFFDWEKNLTEMVEKHRPTTLIIMIGTNDNKSLKRRDGKRIAFGNGSWAKEYTRRMKRLFEIARKYNPKCRLFWVGAPIMEPKKLNTDVMQINHIIRTLCQRTPNCRFVDTWDALADDAGQFTQYARGLTGKRIRLRADDGVHVTHVASQILAVRCLKAIADAS